MCSPGPKVSHVEAQTLYEVFIKKNLYILQRITECADVEEMLKLSVAAWQTHSMHHISALKLTHTERERDVYRDTQHRST